MFFHPQQGRFRNTIVECIEWFGTPRVVEADGKLRIALTVAIDVQTLYAVFESRQGCELEGVVVYTRHPTEELLVLHIAVKEGYTAQGLHADIMTTYSLLGAVCRVARQIQGVQRVRLAYARGKAAVNTVFL
jgi:hypothetical protein